MSKATDLRQKDVAALAAEVTALQLSLIHI